MNTKTRVIHSVLFYLNEEVNKKRLAEIVGVTLAELEESLSEIKEHTQDGGVVLVETGTSVSLGTHADSSGVIDSLNKQEGTSPLSKAALETLAVVLYQSPVSRAEIDVVRGVNSLYSIRNLLVRGLVSRRTVEGKVIYEPTIETLQLLGVSETSALPDYTSVLQKLDQISRGQEESSREDAKNTEQEAQKQAD